MAYTKCYLIHHKSQHLWLIEQDIKLKIQVPIHVKNTIFKLTIPKASSDSVINASDVP